jgi:glycosyltransferase involved in cell wall biosynthesis
LPDAPAAASTVRRVGFDAIRAIRNSTGLGNYARGILRALHQYHPRVELRLYSPLPPRPKFSDLTAELNCDLQLPPYESTNPLSRVLWRTFRLGRAVAKDHVQLYHGLSHEIPRDLAATGIPSVVSFADLIYEKFPRYFPLVDRWSYRLRYRWSARHATAIVAISQQTRDDLVDWYQIDPARIVVVPPVRRATFAVPVATAERAAVRARYHLPEEFLVSLGTLEPRKNHRLLLTALSKLPPDATPMLVLIGRDGGSLRSLGQAIKTLGLGQQVRVLTDVATAHLPALLQSATIFLYPSRVEGFGMPIVEALSAGTPVITSDSGCFIEAGGPGSRYLSPDDADGWASAIEGLVGDAAARDRMRNTGRTWARQFDGDRLAAHLTAVYDAVLAGSALPARLPMAEAAVERVP